MLALYVATSVVMSCGYISQVYLYSDNRGLYQSLLDLSALNYVCACAMHNIPAWQQ